MTGCNFYQTRNIYRNLNDQQQFRLDKINKIKDYFIAEIKEKKIMSKRRTKYIASFDYFDKSLIVLSVTTFSISIVSFATVIRKPAGIKTASLAFAIFTWIVKKLLKTTRYKTKKHNKIVMLARSELSSIENKVSEALLNSEINHEDLMTISNEEKIYRELKESIRIMNSRRSDTKIN